MIYLAAWLLIGFAAALTGNRAFRWIDERNGRPRPLTYGDLIVCVVLSVAGIIGWAGAAGAWVALWQDAHENREPGRWRRFWRRPVFGRAP